MSSLPPYTGRTSIEPEAEHLGEDDEPVIRWGWMVLLQVGAGTLVGFLVPLLWGFGWFTESSMSDPSILPLLLLVAVGVGLFGGGVPFMAALILHGMVARHGRDQSRELWAVAAGAFLGSIVFALPLAFFSPIAVVIAAIVIGVPSAIGFSAWVGHAWRRQRASVEA